MNTKVIDHTILLQIISGKIRINTKYKTIVSIHSLALLCFIILTVIPENKSYDYLLDVLRKLYTLHDKKILQIVGNTNDAYNFAVTKIQSNKIKNQKDLSDNFLWVVSFAQNYKYNLVSTRSKKNIYEKFSDLNVEYL